MQEEQTDEAVEPTAEGTSEADADATLDAVDQQAEQSDGTAAEQAPEVPDDASETIQRAQEHINSLNMDQERSAAEQAQKRM